GSHGAARISHRIDLVDRDGRQDPLYAVDLRFVHAVQELPRIRRKGFYIAALTFGVKRIERERTLAGTRHAGQYKDFARFDRDIEVSEVVLACARNADL